MRPGDHSALLVARAVEHVEARELRARKFDAQSFDDIQVQDSAKFCRSFYISFADAKKGISAAHAPRSIAAMLSETMIAPFSDKRVISSHDSGI
jgi:hypothetical protein